MRNLISTFGIDTTIDDELTKLSAVQESGIWDVQRHISDPFTDMGLLEDLVQKHCPVLLFLLDEISRPQRKSKQPPKRPIRHFIVIISILLFTRRVKKCNNVPMQLGIQLHAHGCKCQVIDLCHHLGFCAGYSAILKATKSIQETTQKEMRDVANDVRPPEAWLL